MGVPPAPLVGFGGFVICGGFLEYRSAALAVYSVLFILFYLYIFAIKKKLLGPALNCG